MGWTTETTENKTSVNSSEQFSANITLNPGELAHVEVDANPAASPSFDLIVSVYGSLDQTNYDDTPLFSFMIDKDTDQNQAAFVVSGVYSFKVGVKVNGASSTYTGVDINWRKDGVNL
jgi:hypothetical protein